jgi:hypothetical protein
MTNEEPGTPAKPPVDPIVANTEEATGKPPTWALSSAGTTNWTWWHTMAVLLIIAALLLLGWKLRTSPDKMFPITLASLTTFVFIAGHGTVGLWRGVLVDERNRMSLSRLQLVLWTIVVLSGFLTAALWNIARGTEEPLSIGVSEQLWLLLGISTTSLVASPLILSTKKREPPATLQSMAGVAARGQEVDATLKVLEGQGLPPQAVEIQGDVVSWKWPGDARVADLFQGDEIGNAGHLDLGKVQMLFFTVILVLAYTATLAHWFWKPDGSISRLPELDSGMTALLAISHGGYLANKAVPHSAPST